MRVLLTGSSGFVGQHVLRVLKERFDADSVVALSSAALSEATTIPSLDYSFRPEYLLECGCADVSAVIHLGAFIPKSATEADDVVATAGNVRSTAALLAASELLPKLSTFVYVSTVDVYGAPDAPRINELCSTEPTSLYGWSKLHCEKMVQAFCRQKGLRCVILRLGHVYGEGERSYRKALPVMLDRALSGRDVEVYGDGSDTRTFVYVGDVAIAVSNSLFLESDAVINVVGDEAVSMRTLAGMIAGLCGVGINMLPSNQATRNLRFDNSRMHELLLDEPTSLSVGLAREAAYMRASEAF